MADWREVVRARLTDLRLTASAESELTEELAQHLEDLHRDLRSGGADRRGRVQTDAFRTGRHLCTPQLASTEANSWRSTTPVPLGDATSRTVVDDLRRDLRYAGRALRANPLFALVVVVTLGLGIGANTTVFTVVNTLILSPMPVSAPSELMAVASVASTGTAQANTLMPLSHPNFTDYQTQNSVFSGLAGYSPKRALTWQAQGALATAAQRIRHGQLLSDVGRRDRAWDGRSAWTPIPLESTGRRRHELRHMADTLRRCCRHRRPATPAQ